MIGANLNFGETPRKYETFFAISFQMDTIGHENVKDRAWSYITLGYGHGEQWWREFCYRLRLNGYDGWLSIEHEDVVLSRMEGMRRSVDLLKRTSIDEPSD